MDQVIQDRIPLFQTRLSVPDSNGCINWTGRIGSHGYGEFCWGGVQSVAHRFAYLIKHGELPKNGRLKHTCENRKCVNADHLVSVFAVSFSRMTPAELSAYFWGRVEVGGPDDCWHWIGSTIHGYGDFSLGKAHRVAWKITFGKIKDGLFVCHDCDNRRCCNPNHLFLGTCKDNADDASKKGRLVCWKRKLTNAQVVEIRASNGSFRAVGRKHGITHTGVSKIKSGKHYKNIR